MLELLWGDKATACLDLWSLQHALSGMIVGYLTIQHSKVTYPRWWLSCYVRVEIITVLLAAYMWEVTEHYLETGAFGNDVAQSFHSVEFWANRMVFDPMMMVIGYFVIRKYPDLVTPAIVAAVTFLLLHSV